MRRLLLLALGLVLLTGAGVTTTAEPADAATIRATDLLSRLTVAARVSTAGYSPAAFTYWTALDGSCRTTQQQVLKARSTRAISPASGCGIRTGRWTSAFSGSRLTSTRTAQVQWTVPLQAAWQAGAGAWTSRQRQGFANDLAYTPALLVVDAKRAKARGSKDPTGWLPATKQRCSYVKAWVGVKARWRLTVTTTEKKSLAADLKKYCSHSPTLSAPAAPDLAALTGQPDASATPSPNASPSSSPTATPTPTPSSAPAPAPSVVPTAAPTPIAPPARPTSCPSSKPIGADLRAALAATADGTPMPVPGGLSEMGDFTPALLGLDFPQTIPGITGAADGSTTVQMTRCTSTHAGDVPTAAGSTNQLSLIRISGSPTITDLTLQGTEQGHRYNGLRLNRTTNATLERVTVRSIPGNSDVNPGETFGINDYATTGSRYNTVTVDGASIGATGLGLNSSTDTVITDSTFTRNRYSAGIAAWQTSNLTLQRTTLSSNKVGLNLERAAGPITLNTPTFSGNTTDIRIASDKPATATLVITDPVITSSDGRIRITIPATYRGVANTQTHANVTVLHSGIDITASAVTWQQ